MADLTKTETPQQELLRLRAENAKLKEKAASRQTISMKVSEKGALSVYGLGRFPVTLYASQWSRLVAMVDQIKAFLADHASELATKE